MPGLLLLLQHNVEGSCSAWASQIDYMLEQTMALARRFGAHFSETAYK